MLPSFGTRVYNIQILEQIRKIIYPPIHKSSHSLIFKTQKIQLYRQYIFPSLTKELKLTLFTALKSLKKKENIPCMTMTNTVITIHMHF